MDEVLPLVGIKNFIHYSYLVGYSKFTSTFDFGFYSLTRFQDSFSDSFGWISQISSNLRMIFHPPITSRVSIYFLCINSSEEAMEMG